MSIIPSKNKTTIIEGEDNDLSQWPVGMLPYKAEDGSIQSSGLRMLSSGTLLAPVGFSVESGSIDFGDVLRLSESAGFLAFENMVDQDKYQLLDYAVPRDSPSSKPYYFKLIESQRKALSTDGDSVVTTNPLSFEYKTTLTARTNALIFKATQKMDNVRLRITDKKSGVAVKYFPSKSAWVDGVGGTVLEVGDNLLDFQDTAVIFQANTDIIFDIQADNISLSAADGKVKFAAMVQEGVFVGVADTKDLLSIQDQIESLNNGFSGKYQDLENIPTSFIPSTHTHLISDVEGLEDNLLALADSIESANGEIEELSPVAKSSDYNDLINKPIIPTVKYPVTSVNSKTGAINLTAVDVGAIGLGQGIEYAQITNPPNIPAAVTNTSQLVNDSGYISSVNYPVLSVNGKTGTITLTPTDVGAASVVHSHPISDIAGLQATLDSKAQASSLSNYATTISVSNGLSLKLDKPNANSTDYIRGDGTTAPFPAIPVASVNAKTGVVTLNATDVGAAAFGHTHVMSEVNGLQAALDAKAATSALSGYATTTALTTGLAGKYNSPTGTAAQYLRGDGSVATFPSIPAAQVNSDWNAVSGVSQILNKPTTFTPSAHTHVISDVTGLQVALNAKLTTPAGTTSQYIRGDGSLATLPVIPTNISAFNNDTGYITTSALPIYRRIDNSIVAASVKVKYYTATSDANAVWTVNTGSDFTEILDVQVQPVSMANTVVGVRSASLNSYTSTSTSVSGVTYGNNVLTTVLIGLGANTLALVPTTVVRVRVEGK